MQVNKVTNLIISASFVFTLIDLKSKKKTILMLLMLSLKWTNTKIGFRNSKLSWVCRYIITYSQPNRRLIFDLQVNICICRKLYFTRFIQKKRLRQREAFYFYRFFLMLPNSSTLLDGGRHVDISWKTFHCSLFL